MSISSTERNTSRTCGALMHVHVAITRYDEVRKEVPRATVSV
jgi:hypothetical protein